MPRATLHFCLVGDGAVFLDAQADRYFRLAAEPERKFIDQLAVFKGDDPGNATELRHSDIHGFETVDLITPLPRPPQNSVLETPAGLARPKSRHHMAVAVSLLRCWLELRFGSFDRAIRRVRNRSKAASLPRAHAAEDLAYLAGAFERCRRTMPMARICLLDSLALIDFLARHRHFPDLVIGVTLFPFAAHCWVQSGEWVLNEKTDLAASFMRRSGAAPCPRTASGGT